MVIYYSIAKISPNFLFLFIYQFLKHDFTYCDLQQLSLCCLSSIYMVGLWKAWKEKKKIIPACVVLAIQRQFPEADGIYTGFKDPSITVGLSIFGVNLHLYTNKRLF